MTQPADIQDDPFLVLLTDALRAGPGSPSWHEAVTRLKTSSQAVDEYQLLIDAREALESGKEYRAVRAGPGFTDKLMNDLDRERLSPRSARRISVPGFIALLASLAILAVISVTIYRLYPRQAIDNTREAIEELASTYFASDLVSSNFDEGIPVIWRKIGSLPVEASAGLRAGQATAPPGDYLGGGVVTADPQPAGKPLAFQVMLQRHAASEDLIPQIFVSNDPDFSADRAVSSHELVWQLQGNTQKVVSDGRVERQASLPLRDQSHVIRFVLGGDLAIVEADNRRLWAGHTPLGSKPRYLGVRFIRTDGKGVADMSIESVRVLANH